MISLKPAIAIMNNLKYPQKFLLISTIFRLPMVLIMYLLITEINTRVEFANKEIISPKLSGDLANFLEGIKRTNQNLDQIVTNIKNPSINDIEIDIATISNAYQQSFKFADKALDDITLLVIKQK
jgi:phosphoserine phosphatase RsbU/P